MSTISTVNNSTPFHVEFSDTLTTVNEAIAQWIDADKRNSTTENIAEIETLWEAIRYCTLDAGKRIRPVLAIECCLACGGKLETILPTACAIELIHAQSLVHDDLPCMDDDDLRRGKPTVHKAFDEATAVLTGDALIALAFGWIAHHTPKTGNVTDKHILEVITRFSQASSLYGLVNGQYIDIVYEGKEPDQTVIDYIHGNKTGALFKFSTYAGAKLSGVDEKTVSTFEEYGHKLGLAFQIVDDLLDIQSTAEVLGKTTGKDEKQGKATYPALIGIEASRQKAQALIEEANNLLGSLDGIRPDKLNALAHFIEARIN